MPLQLRYLVGSLSSDSINRRIARALVRLAPSHVALDELPIQGLPLYSPDLDVAFPPEAAEFKRGIEMADGVIVVSPEYNRGIPGVLKNAIDIASRPYLKNSWTGKPVAVVGTGLNSAGTAVAQASLRSVLGYCGTIMLGSPETCLHWSHDLVTPDGIPDEDVEPLLRAFLQAAVAHVEHLTTVGAAGGDVGHRLIVRNGTERSSGSV